MTDSIERRENANSPPLAYSISALARDTSLSRATLYSFIKDGLLKTSKCGRRTIILRAEAERWLASLK